MEEETCGSVLMNADGCNFAECEREPHDGDPWHEASNRYHDKTEEDDYVDIRWKKHIE